MASNDQATPADPAVALLATAGYGWRGLSSTGVALAVALVVALAIAVALALSLAIVLEFTGRNTMC